MLKNPFKQKKNSKITINGNPQNVPKNASKLFKGNPLATPVVFETKKQYVGRLIKNQEKKLNYDFSPKEEKKFMKEELGRMKNVRARYTTKTHPFMKPQTIFFTDNKITPKQLRHMAQHEYQHAAWEPFDSKTRCVKNFKIKPDRHSKNMGFLGKTTLPITDYPEQYSREYETKVVKMSPSEYIRQAKRESDLARMRSGKDMESQEDYEDSVIHRPTVEKLKPLIKSKKRVVANPWLERQGTDDGYDRPIGHEGRHRAVAAREAGVEEIDVFVTRRKSPKEFEEQEKKEQEERMEAYIKQSTEEAAAAGKTFDIERARVEGFNYWKNE